MDLGNIVSAGSSLLGGLFGDSSADKQNKMQMDLAKNSIKYRVEDAKNAGIHPLYALGAQGLNANTVSSPMGQAVADAGTAISRGISNSYEKELKTKNLENIQADIDLKRAQATGFIAEAKRASNIAQSKPAGRTAPIAKYIQVRDPRNGKLSWVANPDVYELGEGLGTVETIRANVGNGKPTTRSVYKNKNPRSKRSNPRSLFIKSKQGY